MPRMAKPLSGLGSGVLELALRYRGDAFRVVYALRIGADIWVVHAFKKKSKTGLNLKTPKMEIDLVRGKTEEAQGEVQMSNDSIDTVRGSGNVYRDFGYPDAEIRQAKAILGAQIIRILDREGWSTRQGGGQNRYLA